MKKFAEKFTWNRAYWVTVGFAWMLQVPSLIFPVWSGMILIIPTCGLAAFAVFAVWTDHKERRAREAAAVDHAQD